MYVDGNLEKFAQTCLYLVKKNWDVLIIIDGVEGSGKSKLAQIFGKRVDPTLNLTHITFTAAEYEEAVKTATKGQAVIMDEGMQAFFSRTAMTQINIDLVRMLAESRQRNLIHIVCLPSIFDLDHYLALQRADCLIHVYADDDLNRGRFTFYDKDRLKDLYLYGKPTRTYKFGKPNFYGRFTNYKFPWDAEYEAKKTASLVKDKKNEKKAEKMRWLAVARWLYKNRKRIHNKEVREILTEMRQAKLKFTDGELINEGDEEREQTGQ